MKEKPVITIIGVEGKLGSWFKRFFEDVGVTVLGIDISNKDDQSEFVARADIVIISVPIDATNEVIYEVRGMMNPGALLADFTSLKSGPVREMMKVGDDVGVCGIHPLFGPLTPTMRGQVIVFCSTRENEHVEFLRDLFESAGAHVIESSPEDHDRRMAVVQALTHFLNIVFIKSVSESGVDKLNLFSTPVYRLQSILAGRIIGGAAELYGDIQLENEYSREILDLFMDEATALRKIVDEKDRQAFSDFYTKAQDAVSDFIPVAQSKSNQLIASVGEQPVDIKAARPITVHEEGIVALGPRGTFSHQAAREIFHDTPITFVETIHDVFDSVVDNRGSLGVVPIENSTQGLVQETVDSLIKYPLVVVGSYRLPVHLHLMSTVPNPEKISVITSHPQPLAQSRHWLAEHYPNARLEPEASSVKAIESSPDETVAFIAGKQAAEEYGLHILASNIEDSPSNSTQFYIMGTKKDPDLSEKLEASKTALILVIHDRPGVLRDILTAFADRGLNLSRLDSRASDVPDWDYYFFLEVEALADDPVLKDALKEVDRHCYLVRVLGVL